MKHLLILFSLLLLASPVFSQSKEKPCYISVSSSDEFNQTLLSNISISIISQYFKEIIPFPPSGLGGSDNCIYDVTVSSEGGRTFVTLQGKDMNSFGDSNFVGIDGFQQSLLKSLYRSLSDKRKLICEGYGEYLEECGGGSSLKDRGFEEKKCYLTLESNNKKNIKLFTNISVSIVSQYVTKVEKDDPLIKRPLGKSDSCIYEIVIEQTENTLFTTVTGEGLNSYGDSKLKGIEGFQQSLLKSLFRSLKDKRGMICDDYRDLLDECKNVVVQDVPKQLEPKVVETPKVISKVVKKPTVRETKVDKKKGLFVSVGRSGTILTSPDGNWWTQRTSGTDHRLLGVTYGNGLFVVVGYRTILTSTDGTIWTETASGTDHRLLGVTYGNGLFVVVGYRTILTSPDGNSWTKRNAGRRRDLKGVTYGNGLFVTVGHSGTILTSPDGNSWTSKTNGTKNNIYGVTYGNGLFVTVGESGTILTSTDGNSWTERTPETIRRRHLKGVTYGNGLFVTVGHSGTILTSPDGNSWKRNGGPDHNAPTVTSYHLYGVTYGNGTFVTAGHSGTILTSTDGTIWAETTSGTSYHLKFITYSGRSRI
jgi:hypothetical protein